jgi:hypothetical protein
MYKSKQDLDRVIGLGKPTKVIDVFVESYLQGLEYAKWLKVQEDEHEAAYPTEIAGEPDEEGNPTTIDNPDYIDFYTYMDETVVVTPAVEATEDTPAVAEVTELVREYEEVSVEVNAWKVANYESLRKAEYPDVHEYIDAIVKADEAGKQAYIDKCLAVKTKYPKGL